MSQGNLLIKLIANPPLKPYNIYYMGSGGKYAATCFHYCKENKYQIENSSNNVEGSLKYAYYHDTFSGEPSCIKSWNPKYPIDSMGCYVKADSQYIENLLSRFEELDMKVKQSEPIFNYSQLNAEINYACYPKQALKTGSAPNAPYITPDVAKKIIEDLKKLNEK